MEVGPGSSSSASALMTGAARSAAVSAASERPAVPMGVRRAAIRTGASAALTTGIRVCGEPPEPSRPARVATAARSTLPPAVTGNCGRWNHSRGRCAGDSVSRAAVRARSAAVASATTAATTCPSRRCGTPTTTTSGRPARRSSSSTSATSTVAPPVSTTSAPRPATVTHPAVQAAAVADGGEAVGGDGERPGLAVVAVGEVRRAHPEDAVPDPDLDAGERAEVLLVRAPGDERQLRGPVVVADLGAGRARPVGEVAGQPVTGDDDVDAGQVGAPVQFLLQHRGGEVGVRGAVGRIDDGGAGVPGVDGGEEVHRGRQRTGHPDAGMPVDPCQPGDVREGVDPGLVGRHHGPGTARGARRPECDQLDRSCASRTAATGSAAAATCRAAVMAALLRDPVPRCGRAGVTVSGACGIRRRAGRLTG